MSPGLRSDTAPILRWKSQWNEKDQQKIRRTTFNMSPWAKPHPNRINHHRKREVFQVCINFMHWVTVKNKICKYYSQDGGKSSPQLATKAVECMPSPWDHKTISTERICMYYSDIRHYRVRSTLPLKVKLNVKHVIPVAIQYIFNLCSATHGLT